MGGQKFHVQEEMFDNHVNVDKNAELCIEISIDLIEIVHLSTRVMGFNNGNEIQIKKASITNNNM